MKLKYVLIALAFVLSACNISVTSFPPAPAQPVESPTETVFGKNGIRVALLKQVAIGKELSRREGKPDQGLIVNIKASDSASYRNLVDILDEMAITKPQLSAIGEITPAEIDLLKQSGLY